MSSPAVRCKAISKQTGKQCKNWAIKGGQVCRNHGGGAPAVSHQTLATLTGYGSRTSHLVWLSSTRIAAMF
jgi:hypothetical protein